MKLKAISSTPIILLAFSVAGLSANAQKLPNVQKGSVLAPANIKIDGKASEWDNFQAYNHATDIFYTVSNDDKNLYLTVQATDPQVINKIIGGGITFTIQKSGKKNDKDGMSITYPIFDQKNRPYLRSGSGPQRIQIMAVSNGGGDVQITKSGGDDKNSKIHGDSAMRVNNKKLDDNSKYIAVSGIKGLDSLVSVFNEDGIKVAQAYNTEMAYTYELAVSLKDLDFSADDARKIAYHITVNASTMGHMTIKLDGGPSGGGPPSPEMEAMMAKMSAAMGPPSASTDFWGEYTLAKK